VSRVFKQKTSRDKVGIFLGQLSPQKIQHHPYEPSTLIVAAKPNNAFESSTSMKCACIGCITPKCMKFAEDELTITDDRLSEFPADADDSVCPLGAITWDDRQYTPQINADHCINCGICAKRCPIGAIYSNGENAVIHTDETNVRFLNATLENIEFHKMELNLFLECEHVGLFTVSNEKSVASLYRKLGKQQTNIQFPNLIVRNLFLVLGNQCIIRRRGDIYFRIDAILADIPVIGVAEVEFNKDSLESPRAILDDIAVLVSRYEIEKTSIRPYIISLEFPNIRTEYWRVIKDINDVLGIRIHSLTLGALCILAWSFVPVSIGRVDFYADVEMPSIKAAIEEVCGKGKIPEICSVAVLEPTK
jgi:ferredoxin